MSEEALIELASIWGSVQSAHLQNGLQGAWCAQYRLIIIDSRLDEIQRRCVLAHEISHARHHDTGCASDHWAERRANMEASALLINPMEYAFAEQIYDGNAAAIARELGVMPWVVEAYRERLHDDPHLVVL